MVMIIHQWHWENAFLGKAGVCEPPEETRKRSLHLCSRREQSQSTLQSNQRLDYEETGEKPKLVCEDPRWMMDLIDQAEDEVEAEMKSFLTSKLLNN
jgi:hypothetical protein